MNKEFLTYLRSFVNAVTRADYCKGQEITRVATDINLQKDEKEFLESLELMSVKLEAREFALEETIKELRASNADLLEAKRKNQLFSSIFVSLFLSITFYVFLIFLAERLDFHSEDSARIVEVIFLVVCILIIRKGGLSFSSLGVTLAGASRSIRIMLPGTIALCAGLIVLKYFFFVSGIPGLDQEFIIMGNFDLLFAIYLPVAIFQEFLARGVIQTAIESVLDGRNARFWAIITASALFGLVHIQLSVGVALASFLCSIYWGYLYSRQRCLVGVSLSHFLIGDMAYVLGFWDYLHII
jgi:hypothetical protein